jgi:hypothetical protein
LTKTEPPPEKRNSGKELHRLNPLIIFKNDNA